MRIATPSMMSEMLDFIGTSQMSPQQEEAPSGKTRLLRDPGPTLLASKLPDLLVSGAITLRLRRAR
jgi:hypothetical protein